MVSFPLSPKAKRCGNGYIDCCPAHEDKEPSLSIGEGADGKLLLNCFAGCSFEEIILAAGLKGNQFKKGSEYPSSNAKQASEVDRIAKALSIWKFTSPLKGTLAETYLRSRCINTWSDEMRFHPKLYFSDDSTLRPAMVCLVRRNGKIVGVHRTFLSENGQKLGKKMLGPCGGGTVYVGGKGSFLAVAEGIENALSIRMMSGDRRGRFHAALSASGISQLELPKSVGDVMIFPDGDEVGITAGYKLGQRASLNGWNASTLLPPKGQDWNDKLITEMTDRL